MGLFGGASADAQRKKQSDTDFKKKNPAATLYNKPQVNTGQPYKSRFARPKKKQGGGGITENTGMSIPGAAADRQLIATQPGEYILPVDTVTRLGGPNAIDRLVASTDSNSTAAKLGTLSRSSMAVGQPVMSDDSIISTLPPIVQSMGGGAGGGGAGFATKVPSVSVSSNSSRRNAKTMYGLV
jgi:hypothetical protein